MKNLKSIIVALLCVLMCLSSTACAIWDLAYKKQEKEYYSDKSNFVSVTAVCLELNTNERFPGRYFINVDSTFYTTANGSKFSSQSFEIGVANATVLKEAGIEEKLTPGVVFTFISAPEYFGDGYDCPIVGLEINGEVLLDFETGYKNLMAQY